MSHHIGTVLLWAFFIGALSTVPATAMAQFGGLIPEDSISLTTMPQFPGPGESVKISLNDYTMDTVGSSVSWSINGVENTGFANSRSITITAGDIGVNTTVRVALRLRSGVTMTATHTITPVQIDLIIEGNTLTPAFYAGRALPSNQTGVRATALVHTAAGSDSSLYSYLWHINGTVHEGGSVRGRNSIIFSSQYNQSPTISVDVMNSQGTVIGSQSLSVPMANPELHFYTNNPLRGLSKRAMEDPFILVGNEVTVRAEPYFVGRDILSANPLMDWRLNRSAVSGEAGNPQEITLRRQGEQGNFSLSFHIRNLQNLLQGVERAVRITF